jgi:hypothetical protein
MAWLNKLTSTLTGISVGGGPGGSDIRYNLYQVLDSQSEITRVQHFQKLYDYYINDQKRVKEYLRQAMTKTFDQTTLDEIQYPYFNITRRIIDRLCLAYKLPAQRYILVPRNTVAGEQGNQSEPDPKMEAANEIYQDMLAGSNINAQAKRWHRYAKLLDTVYVGVVWREDHIEYDILPPHMLYVHEEEENYLEPKGVMFRRLRRMPDATEELMTVYWSEDEHSVLDKDGNPLKGDDFPDGTNPYRNAEGEGVIPYIPLRMRETENHWGEGDSQLVDINEMINILLCSSFDNAIMQAHGQPVAINMGIEGKILTGPKHIIQVENAGSDLHSPSFEFKNPQPAIRECMDKIDWLLKRTAVDHGLPPGSVSLEEKAQSGAAKTIDNWELIEARQDDIEILRPFEKRLFDITRIVWNYHSNDKIPDDAVFGIDFQEIELPQPEKDELAVKQMKLQLGLWTPVDDMIDEDEGIDKDAALALVQENLEIRNALQDQYGIVSLPKQGVDPSTGMPVNGPETGQGSTMTEMSGQNTDKTNMSPRMMRGEDAANE